MAYRTRIYYSAAQKAEMWDRWQQGETLHSIARLFDRHHTSVRGILAATGGIRPPERRRSRLALTLAETRKRFPEALPVIYPYGQSPPDKRTPSTISREVHRNSGLKCYRPARLIMRLPDKPSVQAL